MTKIALCLLIINILTVNCGLLKDVLSPVTEKVQNNALLDEHEHKQKEAEKKGVVTNLVEGLDKLTDPLTGLLNQGNKNKGDEDKANKTEDLPKNDTKVDDNTKPDVTDTPKDISNNTIDHNNLNDTKNANKELDSAKDKLSSTTPTDLKADVTTKLPITEDCTKENSCTEKPKVETGSDQVNVTKKR